MKTPFMPDHFIGTVTEKDRTESLEAVGPCIFPRLNDNCNSPDSISSFNVDAEGLNVQELYSRSSQEITCLVKAAWGLVLQCYTGSDIVCFGVITANLSLAICQLNLEPETRIGNMLREAKTDYIQCPVNQAQHFRSATKHLFNTAIFFNGDFEYVAAGNLTHRVRQIN